MVGDYQSSILFFLLFFTTAAKLVSLAYWQQTFCPCALACKEMTSREKVKLTEVEFFPLIQLKY